VSYATMQSDKLGFTFQTLLIFTYVGLAYFSKLRSTFSRTKVIGKLRKTFNMNLLFVKIIKK